MAQVKYTTKQQAIGGNPIRGEISDIIGAAADKYGLDRSTMERMAQIESAGNPKAKNRRSSAGGLYQFIDSTARQYRLEDRYDPTQASDAGARLMRDNLNGLRKALGREPTAGEAYLAHQQGLKGAIALLKNPQASAVDALSTVMPKKRAEAAVRLNGDPTGRLTAGQFAGLWKGKLDNVSFKVDDKFGQLPTSSVLSNYAPMGMSFSATPGLSALRAAYDDVRTTPPAMGAAIPAYGMMAEQAAAKRPAPAPSFSLGDRVVTDTPNTVGGGILSAAQAVGNFAGNIYSRAQDAAPRPPQGVPQGDALSRLRQTVGAPVSPVQRSPLAAPQAPKTDALSRLRSMAEPSGDMRATPMDTRFAQETQRMDAMAAQPGRRTVVGGQAPQAATQPAKRSATPRADVRAFGRATAEPGFVTSDMARRTPVSVPSAPTPQAAKTAAMQPAPGLARAASAPSSVASATGGVLGMIGSGIAGGFNRTLSALGAAPAAPVGVQQAAQVQQAKAVSPQGYTAQTARAAQPTRPTAGLSALAAATQRFPKADPNKINTAALQAAAVGAGTGLLTGGPLSALIGGAVGYATAPNANNPMNATTFGTDQGGFFGGLGSMFSGGGSGRDSTGASFSRGTYSDGPGRGLSYGASASRSGTRSGPTAGRQPGGSK